MTPNLAFLTTKSLTVSIVHRKIKHLSKTQYLTALEGDNWGRHRRLLRRWWRRRQSRIDRVPAWLPKVCKWVGEAVVSRPLDDLCSWYLDFGDYHPISEKQQCTNWPPDSFHILTWLCFSLWFKTNITFKGFHLTETNWGALLMQQNGTKRPNWFFYLMLNLWNNEQSWLLQIMFYKYLTSIAKLRISPTAFAFHFDLKQTLSWKDFVKRKQISAVWK